MRSGAGEDTSEPEKVLRGVLKQSPDFRSRAADAGRTADGARRGRDWKEAMGHLEQTGTGGTMPDVHRRLQAMLLIRRGGKENLDKARQMFEALVADSKTAIPSDRQHLARLYEDEGNVELACQQYLKLGVARQAERRVSGSLRRVVASPRPVRRGRFVAQEAGNALARRPGRGDLAGPLAPRHEAERQDRSLGRGPGEDAYEESGRGQTAGGRRRDEGGQRLLGRRAVSSGRALVSPARGTRSKRYEPLANSLAQQGRMREAIELCRVAAQSDHTARPALVLAMVLMVGKPAAEDFQLAEATLAKAVADHKDDVDLLSAVAGVRVIQQRPDEAIRLYRQVLALKPAHVPALNNLATLLAEQPDTRPEALQYIDRAIENVGRQPGLLDTKGMIWVFEGKAKEAVPLLREAAATPRSDPRYHFHLAVAYDRSGDAKNAQAALETAHQGNLMRQVLTPSDLQMLADLEKKFGQPKHGS